VFDGVLAGNALAVHDIEYATLGTSLGMNVHDATLAYHGHRNHMDTINAVFKAGSIANMVKTKKLTKGIMYECVQNKVPFVLAGSIRDDGPLPDVITDVVQAQREYKKVLKDASMVIMISTMLHSIATGNMLPASVKVIVGGPAIVHTGADDSVSELIRSGYIDGVLAGNALAVHDIEYATLGTSLGMNVKDATLAYHGHRNHMDTINAVFKAGSIAKMVKTKKLTKGIMYECVKNNIPFVLAGSIRDDGPLPDVITDVAEAQRQYKKVLEGADMVIMISTMLHSIATGNMLPASVKVIVVDISQPTVTKLMDRGTWQALGIVSDVERPLVKMLQHQIQFQGLAKYLYPLI
jgi:hypothetical protein